MTKSAIEIWDETPIEVAEAYAFESCETRNNNKGPIWHRDVVMALIATLGNKGKAARLLGRSRTALTRWLDNNVDVQEMLIDMRECDLDDVESMQMALAKGGDRSAGQFLLKTLAKNRGYVSRQEIVPPANGPVRDINDEMTDEEAALAYENTLHSE